MKRKDSASDSTSFAYYGPTSKHFRPEGGFCISVFALIHDAKRHVLLVRPRDVRKWTKEWSPNIRLMNADRLMKFKKSWVFPGSYIREGESPDNTLRRMMRDQLGVSSYHVQSQKLYNFYDPSYMYPGKMHWDYCFVYNVRFSKKRIKRPWISTAEYVDVGSLTSTDFSSAQGDLAEALGLL